MEMVHRFLRQRFSSVGVVIALGAMALLSGTQIAGSGGRAGLEMGTLAVLILAAGCVSKDAAGGALQMILCRPIRRSDYLLGRYLGILAGYGAYLVGAVAFAVFFARVVAPRLNAAAPPLAFESLGRLIVASLLGAVSTAAVVLLLSTFLPGYGDVLGFILLTPLLALPDIAAQILRAPWLEKAGKLVRDNVLPTLDWSAVLGGEKALGEPTGRWVLAVVVYLVAALAIFSRREFAYGQD
jgi:hypothetical protein